MVKGIPEKEGETWGETKKIIQELCKEKLKMEVRIVRAHRVGVKNKDWPRPTVMKMSDEEDKEKVLENKNRLRGTKIYIEQDYSIRVRQQRRELRILAKQERLMGRRASLNFNKLMLNGRKYQWNDMVKKIEEIQVGGLKN